MAKMNVGGGGSGSTVVLDVRAESVSVNGFRISDSLADAQVRVTAARPVHFHWRMRALSVVHLVYCNRSDLKYLI
jgi:hypothetical protein